ncbi:single-stranded-DNA-specific exonuclease RecJ [Candidatus Gracilibacteria bacterium]|nr:single-stranded-DNA-specific exonuclease RecJ [Candidatus Gracilibacteria bacterium]
MYKMTEKTSIRGHTISYNPETKNQDIDAALLERFDGKLDMQATLDDLHDPYLLADMDKAIERIKQAKTQNEKVIIFGDYDVDGVTSTALLVHLLTLLKFQVSYRLPHRVNDGYGLKKHFVDEAHELGVGLIITVDCGTRDIDVIKHAKELGVDVIITDHHAVPEVIPQEAVALINPKREDCEYPFKYLAGAGVAFKVVMALAKEYMDEEQYTNYIRNSIDIAAIGTVADCMSLVGENRIIVQEGLKQIRQSRSKGIRILLEEKLDIDIDADIFGFQIGPRINAAGRLDSPYKALNLLLNNSDGVYQTLSEIENLNEQRKFLTRQFSEEAFQKVNPQNNILFYHSPAIEHGIIGIVAGRLTEQFYKPSIVLKDEGDKLVGSCRSPEYFSIIEILDKYRDMFIAYGGHKQAAGFSIARENFGAFRNAITKELNAQDFSQYRKIIDVTKVVQLEELGFGFLRKVNQFKPFGLGNPKPLFLVEKFEYNTLSFLGQNSRDHIQFKTKHGYKIFGFGLGQYFEKIKKSKNIDIIFELSEDSWMGKKNLMLRVVDVVVR